MFLAMAQDLRVVIIKLADRLHNMRTLWALKPEDQRRIARETMEIYAPLAARLGIWEIKWQLEDLVVPLPAAGRVQARRRRCSTPSAGARESTWPRLRDVLQDELGSNDIKAEITGRAKHIYSIHKKMEKYAGRGQERGRDLRPPRRPHPRRNVTDCYAALGIVHGLWRPMPGSFDDYIANPKESMYQALHTTVLALEHAAAGGADPHVRDAPARPSSGSPRTGATKKARKRDLRYEEQLAWLRQLMDWQREMSQAEELVEAVKTDIFQDQVFVFTPKGEIKDLPTGSTPLDFAYRIHTDLGHRCIGAKVGGKLVSLNYQLKNGEVIEILTSKSSKGPSRDWMNANLGFLRTTHAREKVRQWFKRQERAENIARGKEMVEKELARLGTSLSEMEKDILKLFKFEDLDDFFLRVGYGEISAQHIAQPASLL